MHCWGWSFALCALACSEVRICQPLCSCVLVYVHLCEGIQVLLSGITVRVYRSPICHCCAVSNAHTHTCTHRTGRPRMDHAKQQLGHRANSGLECVCVCARACLCVCPYTNPKLELVWIRNNSRQTNMRILLIAMFQPSGRYACSKPPPSFHFYFYF